jgi:peptidyl-prolyl cis-trans isomerase D
MLETMRNASKGWLAAVLILMLVGSFGIWGVQDMMRLNTTPTVARVGSVDITPEMLQREFNRFLKLMERDSRVQLTSSEAKALGLDREALDRMVVRIALEQKARDLGLDVSQNQVVDAMKQQIPDGVGGINQQALQQILQQNEVRLDEFMDLVRADLLRQQIMRAVTGGVPMPIELDNALNRFRLERRVAEYVLVDPSRAADVKDPDDAALRKYYETHAAEKYSIPEQRTVTVVTARAADVSAEIQITDEEIKKVYDANKRLYETPEKRTLEQIRFSSEEKAREAKAKISGGQSFEAVAQAAGFKLDDIKLGDVPKTDTTVPAVAFEIPVNAVSEPTKGAFGWVLVRVVSITPGTLKTLDEAKGEIREKFVAERAKDKLSERTDAFEDTRGGGATLEEAAAKHKLPVKKVTIDARGSDPSGNAVEGLPGGDFVKQVFLADSGVDSELTETQDGVYYEFRVDKIAPTTKKPFDQVKADVLDDWRKEQVEGRLKKMADDLVARGNKGESMASIASSLGVAPLKSEPVARYGQTETFGPDTVKALADAKTGQFFSGPVAHGQSIVVGRLAEIQYAPEPTDAPLRVKYSQQLQQAFAGDLAEQFSSAARRDVCNRLSLLDRMYKTIGWYSYENCIDEQAFAKYRATE